MADEHRPVISLTEIAPLLQGPLIWSTWAWSHPSRRDTILAGWNLNTPPSCQSSYLLCPSLPSCLCQLHPLHFQSCCQHDFKDGKLIACLSVCPPLWSRLKYLNNYKLYFYEPLQTCMVSRGWMQLTEYGTDIHERMTLAIHSFSVISVIQSFFSLLPPAKFLLTQWNISTSASYIGTNFCADSHRYQPMNWFWWYTDSSLLSHWQVKNILFWREIFQEFVFGLGIHIPHRMNLETLRFQTYFSSAVIRSSLSKTLVYNQTPAKQMTFPSVSHQC